MITYVLGYFKSVNYDSQGFPLIGATTPNITSYVSTAHTHNRQSVWLNNTEWAGYSGYTITGIVWADVCIYTCMVIS